MNDMVKILGCSAMTVTRAFRKLEETGLFETGKTGVQKYLKGTEERNVILQQLEDALSTPVAETACLPKVFAYSTVGRTINLLKEEADFV